MKTTTESTSSKTGALLATGLACIISLFGLPSCETGGSAEPIPASAAAARPTGALAPGDVINVTFSGAPEMNTQQKIQPNGKVSLPTIGDISVAGKTITSFQAQLTSLYQPHLQDPTVIVGLESAAASVYVSGEVRSPGKVPLDRPMTVLEAVMETGGFTKFANPKQVIVVRNEKGRTQRYVLNLNNTLSGTDDSTFYLRPYDVIYVKQSAW